MFDVCGVKYREMKSIKELKLPLQADQVVEQIKKD